MSSELFKKRVNLILSPLIIVGLIALVSCQEMQVDNEQLRESIMAAYQSRGEKGLLDFLKNKKYRISQQFIFDFTKAAVEKRKEEWLKAALIIAKEKKYQRAQAYVLYQTGVYIWITSRNKKALAYFEKAIPLCQKLIELNGLGDIHLKMGEIYFYNGDIPGALEMYDKAFSFYNKTGAPIGLGNVYQGKGDIYQRSGDYSKVLELFAKALTFYKKARALISQANVYTKQGQIYRMTGKSAKAEELYDKALPLYEKTGNLLGQAIVYESKGENYYHISDNSRALAMYEKALLLHKKVINPIGQGNVYARIGEIYSKTDDNTRALAMLDKAMVLFEKAGYPLGQGNVLLAKGEIYSKTGNSSKALQLLNKALAFYKIWGEPISLGNVYSKMGRIYYSSGSSKKALEMCDKALVFFKKVREPINLGTVYKIKGDIYLTQLDDYPKSLEMYEKALEFYEEVGELEGLGNVYSILAMIYFSAGHNSRSLEMCEKALTLFTKVGVVESEAVTLRLKANVLAKQGKTDEALVLFEKGIAYLEKIRTQTAFAEMKTTFMEKAYNQYLETVLFMLENKKYEKGFKYAEAIIARVFLDQMAEGLVKVEKGLVPDLKEQQDKLVAKLSSLGKEMHKTPDREKKKLQQLKDQYQKIDNEFEELLIKIRLDNPVYTSVRYPQPISVRDLQQEVLKKGEFLVRYFISPLTLYIFLVSKDYFKVIPIKVKAKEIESIIKRFLLAIKDNSSRGMRQLGNTLYKKLFQPVEAALKGNKDIIIIPHGYLATIPFESFVVDKKKSGSPVFLLEKHRIQYIQSASILSILRKHYQRHKETKSFVGFGDPVYDYGNFKKKPSTQGTLSRSPKQEDEIREIHRSRYARTGGILNRLPNSGEEVKAIARLFEKKSQKNEVYLREQASEEKAKAPGIKEFDFIHFACHGILGEDFQSLVLSQLPPDKSLEDGYFTLNEIMNCDYQAKLVVLSACQTGAGKMYKGEGITGLTRAVMYAGTPAVVASLWKVDDTATRELMVKFYKNMLEKNMEKTEALRLAKLELIKNKKYFSPLYWSAFVMYGE